ncbi:MAG: amidophosphoribosyltransferase [Gammaproteobacteria bacterium]
MCGLVGMVIHEPVNQAIYDALTVLQHRGQDAAGIVTADDRFHIRKRNGLVRDVFQQRHMLKLTGHIGIGHVRYPTAGCSSKDEAQPFYVNSPFGICLGHNGNLTNTEQLAELVRSEDRRHLNTGSDSEVLLNVFAHELERACASGEPGPEEIFAAVTELHARCRGAYAVAALVMKVGVVGFRDPHGIRPLVIGRRSTAAGEEHMIASESVALDALGFDLVRDVKPGEAVLIDLKGGLHTRVCAPAKRHSPCIFEYVYFSRPDSILDNISVYKARLRMGEALADRILAMRPDHDIDVVIPVPDTSRTCALPLAHRLGVKYREGFIKNRYIGRTFIMPGQAMREKSVRQKLNAIDLEFRGKNVMLVDDSIVRGTTSRQIIDMAREAGANKVYFASAAPPVRYPNVYGIDMPAARELIAHDRTEDEIAELIGADWLIYQTLDDLIRSVGHQKTRITEFDSSCFSGEYVTGDITQGYLRQIETNRADSAKQGRKLKVTKLPKTASSA